jgi:hypothetical protein
MKWLSLQCSQDFGVGKAYRRAARSRIVMEVYRWPDASDTSNTVGVISELCLKPLVNVVRVRILPKENRMTTRCSYSIQW